jgi:hypothetical protein
MTRVFCTTQELRDAVVECKLHEGKMLYGPMYTWDVSQIRNFSRLFVACNDLFTTTAAPPHPDRRQPNTKTGVRSWNDISEWNVTSATDFDFMFDGCVDFDQPLHWNTINAQVMVGMFRGCKNFNQTLEWNTSNVQNIREMFEGCSSFNKPLAWDVRCVWDMSRIFKNCASFNQSLDWEIRQSNIFGFTQLEDMFQGCDAFNGSCFFCSESQIEEMALSSTPWFKNEARLKKQPVVDEINYVATQTFNREQADLLRQINALEPVRREEELVNYAEDYDPYHARFTDHYVLRAYSILKRKHLVLDSNVSVDFGCYDPEQKWVSDDTQKSRDQKRQCSR